MSYGPVFSVQAIKVRTADFKHNSSFRPGSGIIPCFTMNANDGFTVAGLPQAGRVQLAVGLGNPTADYDQTRHNAGDWLIATLAQQLGWTFAPVKDLPASIAGTARDVRLARTQTYMNNSGRAVGGLARYFNIAPAHILVAHDEADLPPGIIKYKFGGNVAGHNGLRDIVAHLGTKDFWRLRVGIGRPAPLAAQDANQRPLHDHVLARFNSGDQAAVAQALEVCVRSWTKVQASWCYG